MSKPRDFNEHLAEARARSNRAADAVRRSHAEKPIKGPGAIAAAYYKELRNLEAGVFSLEDEHALRSMKIAL